MNITADNWKDLAASGWKHCDDRAPTRDEKLALACEAISDWKRRTGDSLVTLRDLASRSPLTAAQLGAVCRKHLDTINAALGTSWVYCASDYAASGAGAFGRLGGGLRGCYNSAALIESS
jgi:hypothetical protein